MSAHPLRDFLPPSLRIRLSSWSRASCPCALWQTSFSFGVAGGSSALQDVVQPPLTPTPPVPFPPQTLAAHALHAHLLSWFLDASAAPFGVYRMAHAGNAAGKDVGMWFGPSAAAGVLRTFVDAFPICSLGVSVATDGTFYQTDVFVAPARPTDTAPVHTRVWRPAEGEGRWEEETKRWGDRPVLLLLGIQLKIKSVNPVYYETIKLLYTFPQSRDGLFYLDPPPLSPLPRRASRLGARAP
ncbi:hypothetical protein B0H16DRAFT_1777888 [Mycena metata]|uniref:Cysteine protease n=1 Tax=Mycena metata TaxID=1033252 RepID=A0AAD7HUZ7_9AGAR|nr:hypothetical protein B0H16DRAFT_1777888 [Mycena metata]